MGTRSSRALTPAVVEPEESSSTPPGLKPEESPSTFTKDDIPLGTCFHCGKKQEKLATGGFWINGSPTEWACETCKYGIPIPSYPFACEWCSFNHVQWHQGHTYTCKRCQTLKIGQHQAMFYTQVRM